LFDYPAKGGVEEVSSIAPEVRVALPFAESVYCTNVLGDSISIPLAIVDSLLFALSWVKFIWSL
jgi:hypothetical protein